MAHPTPPFPTDPWLTPAHPIRASGKRIDKSIVKLVDSVRPHVHMYEGALWPELTALRRLIVSGRLQC